MHQAYQRIRKENAEALHRWREAMNTLSKGDHYMLVLCEDGAPALPATVFMKFPVLPTTGITLLAVLAVVYLGVHYDNSSGGGRGPVRCAHFAVAVAPAPSVVVNGRWLSVLCDSAQDSEEAVTRDRVVIFETPQEQSSPLDSLTATPPASQIPPRSKWSLLIPSPCHTSIPVPSRPPRNLFSC